MPATAGVGAWLLMRAFASGCTAMTGVEAVSNGVMAFKDPTYKYARLTLTIIIAILMIVPFQRASHLHKSVAS
jgi:amino acid transporter